MRPQSSKELYHSCRCFSLSPLLFARGSPIGKFVAPYFPEAALQITGSAVSFGLVTVLFAMMFKWLPDTPVDWRDVWLGARFSPKAFINRLKRPAPWRRTLLPLRGSGKIQQLSLHFAVIPRASWQPTISVRCLFCSAQIRKSTFLRNVAESILMPLRVERFRYRRP